MLGVLAVHHAGNREFTRYDKHFLQAIAHVLGTTIDRKHSEEAFLQGQRLEAVGRLAGGVSHDFNNVLTAISGFAGMVRADLAPDDPHVGDMDEILAAVDRAVGLTRQLLAFSRQQVLEPRTVALNDIVVNMKKMLHTLLGGNVTLTMSLDDTLGMVKADPGKIEQVILNLCLNARDAMPDGGTITIETANAALDRSQSPQNPVAQTGSYVMLSVTDTGSGMDRETQARVFEPFFSTKTPDKGTGLGLATVYGIVKQSGGEIWLYSEPTFGTSFKIFLPRIDAPAEHDVDGRQPLELLGTETILVVDDDPQNRRVAQRILERVGYTALVAKDAADARVASAAHSGPIHVLATDVLMPGETGPQLAKALRAQRPDLRVIFLSGYNDENIARRGLLDGGAVLLEKPFTGESLLRTIREAIDGPM
jgi:signal transduction histidine kinase